MGRLCEGEGPADTGWPQHNVTMARRCFLPFACRSEQGQRTQRVRDLKKVWEFFNHGKGPEGAGVFTTESTDWGGTKDIETVPRHWGAKDR